MPKVSVCERVFKKRKKKSYSKGYENVEWQWCFQKNMDVVEFSKYLFLKVVFKIFLEPGFVSVDEFVVSN